MSSAVFTDLGRQLSTKKLTLVTAESCTGGLLAALLTEIPGSSEWFHGALVTYSLLAKQQFLGVEESTLAQHGAVSEPTAKAMALGALAASSADLSVSITGIAGPGGGELTTPTGTVWLGWAMRGEDLVHTARHKFVGNRLEVRQLAATQAALGLLWLLEDSELTWQPSR